MSAHELSRPRRAAARARPLCCAALMLALAAGACTTGPDVARFRPAVSVYGIESRIETRSGTTRGELLEVRDTAFVVLAGSWPTLVPFSLVRHARFEHYPVSYRGGVPGADAMAALRRVARYPQGLTAEQLARLLAAHGQPELRVVAR